MLYKTIDNFIDDHSVSYIRKKYPLQGMKYGWKANVSISHGFDKTYSDYLKNLKK